MIKFKQGAVTNPTTHVTKDIIVKAPLPNTIKDIVIGGSIIVAGVTYLTLIAFRNGSSQFELAEFKALSDAGLLHNIGK